MKNILLAIVLPITMVCCESNQSTKELEETKSLSYKCWYANLSDGNFYGVGRSHTDDSQEYDGKVISLNESTTFNYHCFKSELYTEDQMKEIVQSKYD